ncbi:uncharacterized protein BYT42DRAFT_580787 [Radiomyces spectabilis]|uniref:uncharacterized protein n=1 Tax=Radiomyces spectabilis TaxID=64574 RepID=UPI00221E7529|nr:uncharacterized protein BYT42DRAFT_580787 [Radiomyces spectabilis]KAI8371587.1 hypothetical protein BYT42DRAFT_580787 [Radiomyces spectabilis]
MTESAMTEESFVVFSGGSACNFIANAFQSITPNVCYVLGISDNGGSTSELLRVLGGPSIGDLRSRLSRLINVEGPDAEERIAIKELLSYRLPCQGNEHSIRDEWSLIVEGRHRLWDRISTEKKEAIRGFLVLFNCEILKRAHKHFNFCNGSIGNFFLTGARLFFGSLEAAIFLFSSITAIREPTHVVPAINTNHTAAIAALLEDGETLRGQCEISHPGQHKAGHRSMNPIDAFSRLALPNSPSQASPDGEVNGNLVFSKTTEEKLSAAIRRIYYMNEYGQEIYPLPNPKVLAHLNTRKHLVYSIGSLYTSILPCLILRGVGNVVAKSPSLKYKILILNGTQDRETDGYSAMDFIGTITNALNESQLIDARRKFYDSQAEDDTLLASRRSCSPYHPSFYPRPVDHGFRQWPPPPPASLKPSPPTPVEGYPAGPDGASLGDAFISPPFPPELVPNSPPSSFITHLLFLTNSRVPVDVNAIEQLGIRCVAVPPDPQSAPEEPRYDAVRLQEVLAKVISQ